MQLIKKQDKLIQYLSGSFIYCIVIEFIIPPINAKVLLIFTPSTPLYPNFCIEWLQLYVPLEYPTCHPDLISFYSPSKFYHRLGQTNQAVSWLALTSLQMPCLICNTFGFALHSFVHYNECRSSIYTSPFEYLWRHLLFFLITLLDSPDRLLDNLSKGTG